MLASTVNDLQLALAVSERSDQPLIDLQIERGLLRQLLAGSASRQGVEMYVTELCQKTQPARHSEVFDTTPLQVGSLARQTASAPDSGPNSLADWLLLSLVMEKQGNEE